MKYLLTMAVLAMAVTPSYAQQKKSKSQKSAESEATDGEQARPVKKKKKASAAKQVTDLGEGVYGTAGCGLGSIVFKDQPGIIQVVAVTLNGVFYSQTFGITSGTSNCNSDGEGNVASVEQRTQLFVAVNRESLENDLARGQGESLLNLASILGCQNNEALAVHLKSRFQTIFPSQDTSSEAAGRAILDSVKESETLSKSCNVMS